ncbi:MAG: haloacid dehalogenase type II [Alphaproteobacteria bacterium]
MVKTDIAACVFDVYGTLLDFNAAVAQLRERIGPKADALSALWRQKQLEYTWLRGLMDRHTDFWQVTGDALDHALEAMEIGDTSLRDELLALYRQLSPYPEVIDTLSAIRAAGMPTAVLSNGEPSMLTDGLEAAGIAPLVDNVWSVETVGVFKPHPSVYRLATDGLSLPAGRIAFMSANGWDIAGAAAFGFNAIWINRAGATPERLPAGPAAILPSLAGLPQLLNIG